MNSIILKCFLIFCISILIYYVYSNRKDYYIKIMMSYCYVGILKTVGKLLGKIKFFDKVSSFVNLIAYNLMSEYNDMHLSDFEKKGI